MGTIKLPTENLPVVHKKFITQAYAQWQLTWPNIFVSVMHEDGTPVKDLEINNFKIAAIGNGGIWGERPITDIDKAGSSHGFYWLVIQFDIEGLDWNFSSDSIFTVEVFKTVIGEIKGKISYRGQCLAAMQTKEVS
jgi:hypothetical protein